MGALDDIIDDGRSPVEVRQARFHAWAGWWLWDCGPCGGGSIEAYPTKAKAEMAARRHVESGHDPDTFGHHREPEHYESGPS